MSATNRGAKRIEADFYVTPEWAIREFLSKFKPGVPDSIIEPCAGNGAIVNALINEYGTKGTDITAVEIRPEEEKNLNATGAQHVIIGDFLKCKPIKIRPYIPDLIISNPPYSLAQEIIEHSFTFADYLTDIVMLLPLSFLASRKRREFWKAHPLKQLYTLSERPSFEIHCKCAKGHKHYFTVEQGHTKLCPECGEKWKSISTTDATDYAWFVWSNWREPLIKVI